MIGLLCNLQMWSILLRCDTQERGHASVGALAVAPCERGWLRRVLFNQCASETSFSFDRGTRTCIAATPDVHCARRRTSDTRSASRCRVMRNAASSPS